MDNNSLLPPLDYFRFVGKRTLRLFLDMPYLILCLLRGPLNNNRLPEHYDEEVGHASQCFIPFMVLVISCAVELHV